MLTRQEQIEKLEEAFNALVVKLTERIGAGNFDSQVNERVAVQLAAITATLTYLRTIIPNPGGKIDPIGPRRRLQL
jgi:hypothetical protein